MSNLPENSVTLTRTVKAPVPEVFAAWTNQDMLKEWIAPKAEADPQPGGHYRLESDDDAGHHVVSGEFKEIDDGQRIVMTWNYEGPLANGPLAALLTVEFESSGDGFPLEEDTEIHIRHEGLTSPAYYRAAAAGGWAHAIDNLEKLLS